MKLTRLTTLDQDDAQQLRQIKIHTTGALLRKAATPEKCQALAKQSGLDEERIRQWVTHVDLMRIPGIGPEYARLLEIVHISNVATLATQESEKVWRKIIQANRDQELGTKNPTRHQVYEWIKQARRLTANNII